MMSLKKISIPMIVSSPNLNIDRCNLQLDLNHLDGSLKGRNSDFKTA